MTEDKDTAMDSAHERNLLRLIVGSAILDIREEVLTLGEMNPCFIRDYIKKKHDIDMNEDLPLIEECLEEARAVDALGDMGYDFKAVLMLKLVKQNKRLMEKLEARNKEYEEMHSIMAKYREEVFKLRRLCGNTGKQCEPICAELVPIDEQKMLVFRYLEHRRDAGYTMASPVEELEALKEFTRVDFVPSVQLLTVWFEEFNDMQQLKQDGIKYTPDAMLRSVRLSKALKLALEDARERLRKYEPEEKTS